jgi:calcineurin-like phosphoesterase
MGMTGPTDSVIGMEKDAVIERFLTQLPQKYEVARAGLQVQGVMITINAQSKRCVSIKRIRERVA